jgi:two-component system OmpR family response regulator
MADGRPGIGRQKRAPASFRIGSEILRQSGLRTEVGDVMRVLVVEDEVRLTKALHRGLVAEGFTVDVVHDGVDGVWKAQENDYDVIVLDIMLPGMNGYRVCQTLRARGVWTPILMLSSKDGEYDQTDAFDLGADDYVTKPFSFIVLIARLRALIRRGAPARAMVLQAGDLVLDPSRRTVFRAGTEIDLTPREFGVLQCLLWHRGYAVTRTQILEEVWDQHYDGDPNIVEVYVSYLRKKIDLPFNRTTIQTVRGIGYRLSDDAAASAGARDASADPRAAADPGATAELS